MDARVEALEDGLEEVRCTFTDIQTTVREGQANIIALIEKHLGKKVVDDEGVGSVVTETPLPGAGTPKNEGPESSGGVVSEFRHAVRKVELPLFNGEEHRRLR
jgi:hypothetical protein